MDTTNQFNHSTSTSTASAHVEAVNAGTRALILPPREQVEFACVPVHDRDFEPGDEVMLVSPDGDYATEGPHKVVAVVEVFREVIYFVETLVGRREVSGREMVDFPLERR